MTRGTGFARLVSSDLTAGAVSFEAVKDEGHGDPFSTRFLTNPKVLGHLHDDLSEPWRPTRSGSGAWINGRVVLLSHTLILMVPFLISRSSRHGPGTYVRASVTDSLTTGCAVPIARADTGSPCSARAAMRKS